VTLRARASTDGALAGRLRRVRGRRPEAPAPAPIDAPIVADEPGAGAETLDCVLHDLRGPLAAITGYAQLLRRRASGQGMVPASQVDEAAARIEDAAVRMARQIDALLDADRLRAGRPLELAREEVDLVALLSALVDDCQRQHPGHAVRLESAVPTLVGRFDPTRLERVFGNLLDNAARYSPDGGEVRVRAIREPGAAVVEVRDHGLGIPEADRARVFEHFYRGGNVRGWIAGSGIGLTGVRQIVQQHGGTIAVESAEGQGSTFAVGLPLGR
jgi:signal transduction histidine kinase